MNINYGCVRNATGRVTAALHLINLEPGGRATCLPWFQVGFDAVWSLGHIAVAPPAKTRNMNPVPGLYMVIRGNIAPDRNVDPGHFLATRVIVSRVPFRGITLVGFKALSVLPGVRQSASGTGDWEVTHPGAGERQGVRQRVCGCI